MIASAIWTVLAATLIAPLGGAAGKATNAPAPATVSTSAPSLFVEPGIASNSPIEREYEALLALDDAAQRDLDQWIREADALGPDADDSALRKKIQDRIAEVDAAYRKFIRQRPSHAAARIAFGSFLNDTGREFDARDEWERALKLDPNNPALYNNLAGIYGHRGPVTNAFVYFEKAIELAPNEPVYYQNLATAVYLFRKDVKEHYGIEDEQQIFDKALGLYRKALSLDPDNFILAVDLAQTYYGIKPLRADEALAAWRRALELAGDDFEREGILVHLARVQVQAGRWDEARVTLAKIKDPRYEDLKGRIQRTMERKQSESSAPF